MKQLLIATAALSLIGGAAFAQNNSSINPTNNPVSATTAPAGVSVGGGVAAGSMPQSADGSSPTSQAGANMPPPSAPSDSAPPPPPPSSATATADATAPSTYPMCTSKHEDRCVNRSQATHMASAGTRHHMKSMTTTTTTSDQTGTAAPGQ